MKVIEHQEMTEFGPMTTHRTVEHTPTMTDVELLKEFRKRFGGSVLYEGDTTPILASIGLDRIKRFLEENYGLVTRNKRATR